MGKVGKFVLETTLAAGAAIGASILYNRSVENAKKPVKRAPEAGCVKAQEESVQKPNYIDVPIRISKVLRPVESAQESKDKPEGIRLGTVEVKGSPETVRVEETVAAEEPSKAVAEEAIEETEAVDEPVEEVTEEAEEAVEEPVEEAETVEEPAEAAVEEIAEDILEAVAEEPDYDDPVELNLTSEEDFDTDEDYDDEPDYVTIKISDEIEDPDAEYSGSPAWRYADEEEMPESLEEASSECEEIPESLEEASSECEEIPETSEEASPAGEIAASEESFEYYENPSMSASAVTESADDSEETDDVDEYYRSSSLNADKPDKESLAEEPECSTQTKASEREESEEEPQTWLQMSETFSQPDLNDDGIFFFDSSEPAAPVRPAPVQAPVPDQSPTVERVSDITDAVSVSSDPEDDDSDDMTDDYYV